MINPKRKFIMINNSNQFIIMKTHLWYSRKLFFNLKNAPFDPIFLKVGIKKKALCFSIYIVTFNVIFLCSVRPKLYPCFCNNFNLIEKLVPMSKGYIISMTALVFHRFVISHLFKEFGVLPFIF